MKCRSLAILFLLLLAGCGGQSSLGTSLPAARKGFQTKLIKQEKTNEPVDEPPPNLFRTVYYESPAGKMAAYLSVPPPGGQKHPAIIWLVGGFSNSIGSTAWEEASPDNDQSARAFREAGILMMYPSLRGGNMNPGVKEGFFGEVDDVLAAANFLAAQDSVDPQRIYLGGHSTGGTLALLAAESTGGFRAVFSLGPVEGVGGYGADSLPFDARNNRELQLRAPGLWLSSISSPTFVFEGTKKPGNITSLEAMQRCSRNPQVHFHPVNGYNHFSVIASVTELLAAKIVNDTGPTCTITISEGELGRPSRR